MPLFTDMERYLSILDILRQKKFSLLVEEVQQKILEKLNSELFSDRFRRFLTPINVGTPRLLPNGQPLLNSAGQPVLTEIEPYTNFDHEPAQVSQVKKLINALYNAKLALQEAEGVDLGLLRGKPFTSLLTIYSKTIDHAYTAGHLATHLDINLLEIFGPEITLLTPMYKKVQNYAESYQKETKGLWERMDRHELSQRAGRASGIIVDQLDPTAAELDYEFLALFGAEIPRYIDEFTSYIVEFSSSVSEREPNLDRKRLDELQDHALRLLHALENARGSSLFLPLQALHYIHVIRHTITLSMSIFEEAGHLTETTQSTVRSKLEELKTLLASGTGLTDKIEAQSMVTAGILSKPLLKKVSSLYKVLIGYTEKFVNFEQEGQHLCVLEDSIFVAKRLENTYERIASDETAALLLAQVRGAATEFFNLLNSPGCCGRIIDLPIETRLQLATHYKFIQPYVAQINFNLNNAIITALNGERGTLDRTGARLIRVVVNRSTTDVDHVNNVRELSSLLERKFIKEENSRRYQCELNQDIINSVSTGISELKLSPGLVYENPFEIDEKEILDKDVGTLAFEVINAKKQLIDPTQLTTTQAATLYKFYRIRCNQLRNAQQAYEEFCRILAQPVEAASLLTRKRTLRNLYFVFQPYVVNRLTNLGENLVDIEDEVLLQLDKDLIDALSSNEQRTVEDVMVRLAPVAARFTSTLQYLESRQGIFSLALQESISRENNQRQLVIDNSPRARHILKHVEFSRTISKIRAYLKDHLSLFNDTVKTQLNISERDIPFPDLSNVNNALEQSSQVVMVKQIFNLSYHLEQILLNLEELHDNKIKTTFAIDVIQVGDHLIKAFLITQALSSSPYFSALIDEVKNKLESVQVILGDLQEYYTPDPITIIDQPPIVPPEAAPVVMVPPVVPAEAAPDVIVPPVVPAEAAPDVIVPPVVPAEAAPDVMVPPVAPPAVAPIEVVTPAAHTPIFYAVNAMLFLPEHIRALRADKPVEADAARAIHLYAEKVTADLERIIANSNSYLKLSSEVFTMYRLFRDLKGKLLELTTTSHDIVFDNLDAINDKIFAQVYFELDRWEDNFGLKPGILTEPIEKMFKDFYNAFLEPLKLSSKERIKLMASVLPLTQRIDYASQRAAEALVQVRAIDEKQQLLERFLDSVKFYKTLNADSPLLSSCERDINDLFNRVFSTLKTVQERLSPDIPPSDENAVVLDRQVQQHIREPSRIKNIEAFTIACISYFKGVKATHQLTLDTANEKKAYLNDALLAQPDLKALLVKTYTVASFKKKQGLALAAQRVGLVNSRLREECGEALKKYLQDAEAEIVRNALGSEDIDKKLDELIHEKIAKFNLNNYRNYRHLDEISIAVERLRKYVEQPSHLFESYYPATGGRASAGGTLHRKMQQLENLERLIEGACGLLTMDTDPTQLRVEELRTAVNGKNAMILFNNELYYVDGKKLEHRNAENCIEKIKVSPGRNYQHCVDKLKLAFTQNAYKKANSEVIYLIRRVNLQHYLDKHELTFKTTMYEMHPHNVFTLDWLKQSLVWLLELIRFYTPERKACYRGIRNAVNTEPAINLNCLQRFGFFPMVAPQETPAPILEGQANPVEAPALA